MGFIKKIKITSLFGQYDLDWNLNPDVNILAGINGSGKSTLLRCVESLLVEGTILPHDYHSFEKITITTDNNGEGNFRRVSLSKLISESASIPKYKDYLVKLQAKELFSNEPLPSFFLDPEITDEMKVFRKETPIVYIRTFDAFLPAFVKQVEGATELDKQLGLMQQPYLAYQLSLSNAAIAILEKKGDAGKNEMQKLYENYKKFLDILDSFFKETNKKVNRTQSVRNEITFLGENKELSIYQLSAGEKQLLLIFLTLLLHNKKPAVFLMDEPETSLHFDWQRKLIHHARELNPNAQLIIATHSPAIIMEGWMDKIFNIRDLCSPAKN